MISKLKTIFKVGNIEQQQKKKKQINEMKKIQQVAQNIWQKSSKSLNDLINFMQSTQQQERSQEKVKLFISSLTNRQKLLHFLQGIQSYLLEMNNNICKLDKQNRKILANYIHPKIASIFFIWNQISSSSITPSSLHDQKLPQMYNNPDFGSKLYHLYIQMGNLQTIPLQLAHGCVQVDKMIKTAVRTNYPFLTTKQTISQLFKNIIEKQVVIDNSFPFTNFIKCICQQIGTTKGIEQCKIYIQQLYIMMGKDHAKYEEVFKFLQAQALNKENQKKNTFDKVIIQSARLFLQAGYPYAMELVFQVIIQLPQTILQQNQIRLYAYTKIYSLFLYTFEQMSLRFDELQKMSITTIIHMILRNNSFPMLNTIKDVFKIANELETRYILKDEKQPPIFDFEHELQGYIFSNSCNIKTCLQMITSNQAYIQIGSKYPQRQQKLLSKLNQYKFDAITENQNLIKTVIETNLTDSEPMRLLLEKIDEILQIVRLFYMFGVNEKFGLITVFYCPTVQPNQVDQMGTIQQQKALLLVKSLTSKFYISSNRTKKILLNNKSSTPLAIDVSKSQSIFQINQYLYDKFLKKGLYSINQIHQLIFQHMIYFYRYQDAKTVLNNQHFIKKYNIKTQMLQMIAIQSIVRTIKQSTDVKKFLNDVNHQLQLIKHNESVQAQSVKAMIQLFTYFCQNGINLTTQQKDQINMSMMFSILQRYSHQIQLINFDFIYQQIRTINSNQIIDEDQKYKMTNELLKFKSKLATKSFQLGKKKLGNTIIEQISRFSPPWLTTQLIQIFKKTTGKIDNHNFVIALNACSKGSDLKYLTSLWKQQQKNYTDPIERKRQKYLIIDNQLIKDQQQYDSYVVSSQFKDKILCSKKYQLFFMLLGSDHQQAFHYALRAQLDPGKIDHFLKQAMKINVICPIYCVPHLHKYMYYVYKIERDRLKKQNYPHFKQYIKITFDQNELQNILTQLTQIHQKSLLCKLYIKILSAMLSIKQLNQKFIKIYFSNIQLKQKINIQYQLLFNIKNRQNILISLREQPMNKQNIIILNQICMKIANINFVDHCISKLADLMNTSDRIDQKCEIILQKIIILTLNKIDECKKTLRKLIDKIFSIDNLIQILGYLTTKQNILYREIITQRKLRIILPLSSIELQTQSQLYGLIPINYFQTQLKYNPKWPLAQNDQKILRRIWSKTNILILSKIMYFIYGMNVQIQKYILQEYFLIQPDMELKMIVSKLE